MTGVIVLLTTAFVALCVLLLSLNLRSAWSWRVKAAATVLTGMFFMGFLAGLEQMLGWPAAAVPPARFTLHGALIREPDKRHGADDAGAIYLWLSNPDEAARSAALPRAYALPYSRELHRQTARAQERMRGGTGIEGRTRPRRGGDRQQSVQIELFDAPVMAPADKPVG